MRKINGETITDVLDYKFCSYDSLLFIELTGADGRLKLVRLRKPAGADIGLEFDTFLMDRQRSCANKCIFCFIDQLPAGMRQTLYYKDDDVRLSFLQGNYVTLTNLSRKDIGRIIKQRISPINVSVHTLNPELRAYMLGNKNGAAAVGYLKALADAGITLDCQIVCCPGINDGAELSRTMEGLFRLGGSVRSVSIVPVGLTKHREGLTPLRPFNRELAATTVRQVEDFGRMCRKKRGSTVFFCADELYIKAGIALPPYRFYEDFPQLENGVGMMRLFITEFEDALAKTTHANTEHRSGHAQIASPVQVAAPGAAPGVSPISESSSAPVFFSIATGATAAEYLTNLLKTVEEKHDKIHGKVYTISNNFFGESVTVSGLLTGGDIISQLRGRELGSRLLIPQNMLRRGEDIFLDDVTVTQLSQELGAPVRVVRQDGADLLAAILETYGNINE